MYIVSYDIKNNKKRNKVAKILEDYGERILYSVFMRDVSSTLLFQMLERVEKVIEKSEDSIIVIPAFADNIISLGTPMVAILPKNSKGIIVCGSE